MRRENEKLVQRASFLREIRLVFRIAPAPELELELTPRCRSGARSEFKRVGAVPLQLPEQGPLNWELERQLREIAPDSWSVNSRRKCSVLPASSQMLYNGMILPFWHNNKLDCSS